MTEFWNRYKKAVISIVIVAAILIGVWYLYLYIFTFSVVGVSPRPSHMTVVQPVITVTMTKSINPKTVLVSDNSSNIIDSTSVDGRHLKIYLTTYKQYLDSTISYKITIQNLDSKTGEYHLKNYSITFKPSDDTTVSNANQDIMTDLQQKNSQRVQKALGDAHPIVAKLPHYTDDFYLKPIYSVDENGNQAVTLQANIFIDQADYDANNQTAINKVEQEVIDYVNKYDKAENYAFNFVVQPN